MPASPRCVAREIRQLAARIVALDHGISNVRPVEAGDEDASRVEAQAFDDLAARQLIGGGRQGDARHARPAPVQDGKLDVLGAEIVAPLRHTMRFVDREQCQSAVVRDPVEQGEKALGEQALRRDVDQVEPLPAQIVLDLGGRFAFQRGIEKRGAHAGLAQGRDLILHQRDQGRDHDRDAGAQQRRQLVAQ
jgi:hypothetical protein